MPERYLRVLRGGVVVQEVAIGNTEKVKVEEHVDHVFHEDSKDKTEVTSIHVNLVGGDDDVSAVEKVLAGTATPEEAASVVVGNEPKVARAKAETAKK